MLLPAATQAAEQSDISALQTVQSTIATVISNEQAEVPAATAPPNSTPTATPTATTVPPTTTATATNTSVATATPTSAPATATATATRIPATATATPTNTPAPPTFTPTPTAKGNAVLWGVYSNAVDTGAATIDAAITQYQTELSHPVQAFNIFVDWTADWNNVASWGADYSLAHGIVPLVTYEAWNRPLDQIAAGAYDSDIDSVAIGAAATHKEIWLRLFHEFNDCQTGGYPWDSCYWSTSTWIAAWQHVYNRFQADGATNVKFIWGPDGTSSITNIGPYYPGDGYVDFTGWDDYAYNTAANYAQVASVSSKPMVLSEVAGTDSQVAWLQSMAAGINGGSYPLIHAVVWFDSGTRTIAGNPQIEATLVSMLAGPVAGVVA